MNSEEFTTLVKMAVTALILSLVIGAAFIMWYQLSDHANKEQLDMEKVVNTTSMERLYELRDLSSKHLSDPDEEFAPLVTNVVSALSEFNANDLLYIYVDVLDENGIYSGERIYTYNGVSTGSISFSGAQHEPLFISTDIPITEVTKYLLEYSQYRCTLEILDYNYDNIAMKGLVVRINKNLEVY